MKKKTLLIIGSSGFFGNSIVEFISKKNKFLQRINKIILISRTQKNKFAKKLKKNFQVKELKVDMQKAKTLPHADYIIYSIISKDLKKDHESAKNYVRLANKFHRGSNILFTSSGAVYGNQPRSIKKFSETHYPNPKNHKSLLRKNYATLKLKNENLFKQLANNGSKVSIARCFAFVGKNLPLNKNFVIGNFIKNIIENKNILIKSDKQIFRSYMHSEDLSYCLFKILFDSSENKKIFNIGSDHRVDIRKVALKLSKKFNLKVKMKILNKKKIDDTYIPNINRFRKKYKYKKNLDSYKSIIKTINQFNQNA